jgi:hypothetical protein
MKLNIKLILIVVISATLFVLTLVNIKQKEATQASESYYPE